MAYEDDLAVLGFHQRRFMKALHQMAFDIRQGNADDQILYNAIFSDQTRFGLKEAALFAYYFSVAPNDLRVLGMGATDAQIQVCVNGIKSTLITRQKDTTRPIVGLSYFAI
jgi:hypothetical protein